MGKMLCAKCTLCNYEKDVIMGTGFIDRNTKCFIPALNTKRNDVETQDYLKKDTLGKNIVFYNSLTLQSNTVVDFELYNWGNIEFRNKGNKCPKCESFNLTFSTTGFWD